MDFLAIILDDCRCVCFGGVHVFWWCWCVSFGDGGVWWWSASVSIAGVCALVVVCVRVCFGGGGVSASVVVCLLRLDRI